MPLPFDNQYILQLPADPDTSNRRRQVQGACYSHVQPSQAPKAKLVAHSREVARILDFSETYCHSEAFTQIVTGNQLLDDMQPYAMCYGGHQFGHWAGQLGDGRAINLGEMRTAEQQPWSLQLKGAGITPYSRQADGLAVLRSSVREFLCSEAMFHLGVPTTRALSLALTGKQVWRDPLYDGHPAYEPGAVVCRVAPSFVRFGSFEIHSAQQQTKVLQQLIHYTIQQHFPHLLRPITAIDNETIEAWFTEVCCLTAEMVVHWMRVGFVHGVMNTDNMSILGLTIDYGPYGWLENYDPDWTPNTTDAKHRRYRFGNQASVAHWNLTHLAQSIATLTERLAPLQVALATYADHYQNGYQKMMNHKLGLQSSVQKEDESLTNDLTQLLQLTETDMTVFFRQLSFLSLQSKQADDQTLMQILSPAYYQVDEVDDAVTFTTLNWLKRYQARMDVDSSQVKDRIQTMDTHNPRFVLRNYLAQLAIDDAEQGDFSKVKELLEVLRQPYTEQVGKESYAEKRPEWARHRAGCSMLSCSS